MNCLIVDHHEISRTAIQQLIKLDSSLNLLGQCDNAVDAHNKILTEPIDLILLDIEMPNINGIELAKRLSNNKPLIVFTTKRKDYVIEAFNLNVVDFLIKPIHPAGFSQAIDRAKEMLTRQQLNNAFKRDEFIFIRNSNAVKRLNFEHILYFEAKGDYVKISTLEDVYTIHSSLKAVENKLPQQIFLRVHRSFIINIAKIDTVEGGILIINKNFVPVSDAYKGLLNRRMQIL